MANFPGFPKKLIPVLVCQNDKKPLIIKQADAGDYILNGELACSSCSNWYAIKDGIVNLLDKQQGINEMLRSEIKSRDDQAEGYDRRLASRYYKEVAPTLKNLGNLSGKKIIEYGCGTGRLTKEIEKNSGEILAVDFSMGSLKFLSQHLATDKVGLVLADATQVKTKENYFDLAVAAQFFEHIPSPSQRTSFLNQAKETLNVNGEIVSTVYHHDLRRRLKGLPQEGFHDDKIYYRYFSGRELKRLFAEYFKGVKIKLLDITLPLEARLRLPAKIGGIISSFSQPIYPVNRLAHLLFIKGAK